MSANQKPASPKSALIALLLCFVLGTFGVHRFYLGKNKTGILMLLTLGGLGIWSLADLVIISCGEATDSEGRPLAFVNGRSPLYLFVRIIAMVFGFLPMTLLLAMFVLKLGAGHMTDVVDHQLAAIRAGDMQSAYSDTAAGFQEETSFETFKSFVNAYPIIKHNVRATFPTREIENDQGYLSGNVYGKDGKSMAIEYQMTHEDGQWKVLGLRVNVKEEDVAPQEVDTHSEAANQVSTEMLTYKNSVGNYSIKYPDNWIYEDPDPTSVMFSGKKGSEAYASTITVQALPMEKTGGIYKDAKAIVEDLKSQIDEKTTDVKYLREGEAKLPLNPEEFQGYYFEVSYRYGGISIKKLQYVIVNAAHTVGYSWAYTTDTKRYDIDLPIAKAMYDSWAIHQ